MNHTSYEEVEGTLFFNSSRTYTLAILDLFSSLRHYVKKEDGTLGDEVIPIQFGNYEKSIVLDDIENKDLGNWNIVPRMILSFDGMNKAADRTLNKDHKISLRVQKDGMNILKYSLNSVPYDFNFRLLIQSRGMNEAFQIVEQILPKFRPSYPIEVREFPLFEETTKTQLLISDPTFEINEEFEEEDINIINITFDITLRGNLYPPINMIAPIDVVKMFYYIIDKNDKEASILASKYNWEVEDSKIVSEESEHFSSYEPPKNITIIKE